ncbi:hypothetical protein [Microbulbifer sp. 2201CG32-9]|uniref:hypothetical protein n=1 Tax=unclassified Microbulbifer TaxID=2619833 RepID=UPI00345C47BC
MTLYVVVFDPSNGRIHWTVTGATREDLEMSVPEHLDWMIVPDDVYVDVNADYIKDGAIVKRPLMEVTWRYDAAARDIVVEKIPVGAMVTVRNWKGVVNDGFIVWRVAEPGFYRIYIDLFPYQPEWIHAEIT